MLTFISFIDNIR